ncbi:hypothetical protein CDL12_10029 [Handroanthus impetiginosus]|uniref:Myb-like domain-containing protein n=1 Tax=Handroanthus impetiginosus TaxID=429701 RepID=A0A2G9HIG1_9LAMI|nr:hypothetical protein CDL12_10029 [Handroanthus impetiginosus]
MEQSQRSCRIKQHLVKNDHLPKSNELNDRNVEHRKKLEREQAGPSELHSGYSPPFGGKAVDSTKRRDQALNEERQEGKRTRQVPRSPRVYGPHQMACKSQGENTYCPISERNGSKKYANTKSKKSVLYPPETDLPHERECSQSSQSADAEEKSEEDNESSGVSKYFIRVRKQERQPSYPAIPQLRRKRLSWTREEEEALKEGMRIFCSPHDKVIPWKKILEFGAGTFQQSRCTMDLKDKWRNMCKATPKA